MEKMNPGVELGASWVVGGGVWVALSPGEVSTQWGFLLQKQVSLQGQGTRKRLTGGCGDPCIAQLHWVSNTSAQSRKGPAAVCHCLHFLHGNLSLCVFKNVHLALRGVLAAPWELLCGMRGLPCGAQIL